MIYLAAMIDGELNHNDFLRHVGCNPVHASVMFNGKIELTGQRVPEGFMQRYMWRMRDESITSSDITFVVIFNHTREKHSFDEYKIAYERRLPEITEYLDGVKDLTEAKSVDTYKTDEGNLVYILRDCKTEKLSEQFSRHSRKGIQSV